MAADLIFFHHVAACPDPPAALPTMQHKPRQQKSVAKFQYLFDIHVETRRNQKAAETHLPSRALAAGESRQCLHAQFAGDQSSDERDVPSHVRDASRWTGMRFSCQGSL